MKESILKRKSVRTYLQKDLADEDIFYIHQVIKQVESMVGPFNNKLSLSYHVDQLINLDQPIKIGTYGFVKNANTFVSGKVNHSYFGLIDFGYLFEYFILKMTEKNLGTVWLGGTFNRKAFNMELNTNEIIPAITPIGYANTKQSLMDKLIRKRSKGDNRLPFESLFYHGDFKTPLSFKATSLCDALDLIRLAPSASNKQPWRFLIKDQLLHLYLKRTPNYAKVLNFDIQALDIGIALCHMTIAFDANIEHPNFINTNPNIETSYEYIASIKIPKSLVQSLDKL